MAFFPIDGHATEWRTPVMATVNVTTPSFLRRIGPDPHANGAKTAALQNCPDIWELADGNFAVIGIDMTAGALPRLPATAGCGPDERVVWIPRDLLLKAKSEIPS